MTGEPSGELPALPDDAIAFPRPERWAIDFDYHVLVREPLGDAARDRIAAVCAGDTATLSESWEPFVSYASRALKARWPVA